jgi:hypothetical protein
MKRDFLTENQVIEGVRNFLFEKGRTTNRKSQSADAEIKEHGVDLVVKLADKSGKGNYYFVEAKGNLKNDGTKMRSSGNTNFRWAISQIILRIKVDSRNYNYIYGIAMPDSEISNCMKLIRENWALKHLKIRLYGAYRDDNDKLFAKEYLSREIYKEKK